MRLCEVALLLTRFYHIGCLAGLVALCLACEMPQRVGVQGHPSPSLASSMGAEAAGSALGVWKTHGRPRGAAYVPGGVFTQGSSEEDVEGAVRFCKKTYARPRKCKREWFEREAPARQVVVNTFYIDRVEVTNDQYSKCVADGGCSAPQWSACNLLDLETGLRRKGGAVAGVLKRPRHPVVCVDWAQAQAFCKWGGGRLPTEAEWEKAARGSGDTRSMPWGDQWRPGRLNWGETGGLGSTDGHSLTSPVGSFPQGASPFGVHDMAGNAWEWTLDWFDGRFYKRASEENPLNTKPSGYKVLRGGSWSFAGNGARVTYRHFQVPAFVDDSVGFRCVRYPKEH